MIIVDYNPFIIDSGTIIKFNDETSVVEAYVKADTDIEILAEKTLEICDMFNDFSVKFKHNLPNDYELFCNSLSVRQKTFNLPFTVEVEEI